MKMQYIALKSFTTTALPRYDVQKGEILDEDFAPAEIIADLVAAKYITEYSGGGGGGGSGVLTERLEVTKATGGIPSGRIYPAGTSVEKIFKELLNPVGFPQLIPPYALLPTTFPDKWEVGKILSLGGQYLTLNRGRIDPRYTAESGYRSGAATSYRIWFENASVSFDETNTNGGFLLPDFTRDTKGYVEIHGRVDYAQGVQPKDSEGNDYQSPLPAGYSTDLRQIQFVLPFVFGKTNTDTISSVEEIVDSEKRLEDPGTKEFVYRNSNNQYFVIAYDSDYGNLSSIKDQNGFETISGWYQSYFGGYTVYRIGYRQTVDVFKYTFAF